MRTTNTQTIRGFKFVGTKPIDPWSAIGVLKYLALNPFQKRFFGSLVDWSHGTGRAWTDKQVAALNKTLSRVRLYESCVDYPCCGHSGCRVQTMDRVIELAGLGIVIEDKK